MRVCRLAFVWLCVLVGVFGFSGVSAQASKVIHKFESQITEVPAVGPEPQKEQVPVPGKLGEVGAMTVDAGDLYVAERGRVDEFNASTDVFLAQLLDPGPLGGLDRGIGFDDSTGERLMYLGVEGPVSGVGVFSGGPCGTLECAGLLGEEWTGAHTPNESFVSEKGEGNGALLNVAVDDSAGAGDWAKGDVFVATRTSFFGQFPSLNVVDVFNPEAALKGNEPPKVVTQLLGTPIEETISSTEETEPFEHPENVAVSGFNGDVVVIDGRASGSVIDLFEPVGLGEYASAGRLAPPGSLRLKNEDSVGRFAHVAVDGGSDGSSDDGDIYVSETINVTGGQRSVVFEFSPTGGFLGALTGQEQSGEGIEETEESVAHSFQGIEALAVDPVSHRLYVGNTRDREGGAVEVFGANGILPEVASEGPSPLELEKGSHTWRTELRGSVNPEDGGAATCSFVWGVSPAFGHVTPCAGVGESEKSPVPNGTVPVAVRASIDGLEPGTTYYYRVQASNERGENAGEESQDVSFLTPGAALHGESVSGVSSTSATFGAVIDPDGETTSYRFEYDTRAYGAGEAPHGVSIPVADVAVGSGSKEVPVAQHVQGLLPHTVYHYRVVTVAELEPGVFEEFDGADRAFTTQGGGASLALLDGRAWELVSPAEKHGALIFGLEKPFRAPVQASLDGRAVTYAAFSPTESAPAGYGTVEQVVSRRGGGAAGWSSHDISPPHSAPTGITVGAEYQVFSQDLSSGLLELSGESEAPLSGQASERTPYEARVICEAPAADGCYMPLVSGEVGEDKDVPPGTVFGGSVRSVGESPDARHVVLRSSVQLTETPTEDHQELYEWSGDEAGSQRLQLVSLLPEDEGGAPVAGGAVALGNKPRELVSSGVNPISADGSRIFWTTGGALYMRDTVKGETIRLDVAQPGVTGGAAGPLFETASVDGSRAFFTDAQRLTAGSSKRGADLYECELVISAGRDSCVLHDLTPEGAGGPSEVQNLVLGASEDGSYVYFVANGVLGASIPPGVKHGACRSESSAPTTCNLYVSHDGEVKFAATLSNEDELDWGGENNEHTIYRLTARVSPDGRFAAFMSFRSLTGYDNRDVRRDKADAEVFEYDAQTSSLVFASCNPIGARPAGREVSTFSSLTPGAANLAAVSGIVGWAYGDGSGVAADLPAGVAIGAVSESLYLPRVLFDSGRLFFYSGDALVPLDTNGEEDVYEFEPGGVGSCSVGSSAFQVGVDGCVALVSSGTSSEESGFLDASGSGDDVFFLTGERLVGEDRDTALDVYDARVCSAADPCGGGAVSPPACVTGGACRGGPGAQPVGFGAAARATFAGAGDLVGAPAAVVGRSLTRAQKLALGLRVCRKEHAKSKKRRVVCERQERKRYPATSKTRKVKTRKVKTRKVKTSGRARR